MSAALKLVEVPGDDRPLSRKSLLAIFAEVEIRAPSAFFSAPPRDYDQLRERVWTGFLSLNNDEKRHVLSVSEQIAARVA